VALLVLLVDNSILGGSGTGAEACVRVLGDVLVGLLGCGSTGTLDGLGNVVCGVLEIIISLFPLRSPTIEGERGVKGGMGRRDARDEDASR